MRKFSNKLKNILLVLLLMVFSLTPVITGCSLNISRNTKLRTPSISLSTTDKTIYWNEISGAENYEIYLNNTLADTISTSEYGIAVYDFSSILDENGDYSLYVIATTTSVYKENSDKSNICNYTYVKNALVLPTTPTATISSNNIDFTINNKGVLTYIPLSNLENATYNLYVYSNSTGLNTYPLNETMVNLIDNNIIPKSEIYALRIGYMVDDKETINSKIQYFNNISVNYEGYTDKIYLFDGEIHDCYIQNQQELNNFVYYAFVNRIESYNIRISEEYKTSISNIYGGSTINNLNLAVQQALNNLYETMAYVPNNSGGGYASINGTSCEYTIKISYGGIKECDTTIKPMSSSLYPQGSSTTYYEIAGYTNLKTKYGSDYDDFASDKQFLYTTVSTSEQLYWAVENKITPVFEKYNSGEYIQSSAYKIYNEAKNVLREIISDDMTDYEKALSIFDWISVNTQYDYTKYTIANGYSSIVANYPHSLPCFYLEGVFITGYSVCDGFSKAYSLMCNMIGIDCIRIVGDAVTSSGTGGHAWNKVLLDKDTTDDIPAQYYIVDITWTEMIQSFEEEKLSHAYFGLSDSDVADTHIAFTGRNGKYGRYSAESNLYYYVNQTYLYRDNSYNYVIDSAEDMARIFDYSMLNALETIEFVVDYDYMVSVYDSNNDTPYSQRGGAIERSYETQNGKKYLRTEYNPTTDVFTYYIYRWEIEDGYLNKMVYKLTQTIVMNNYKLRTTFQEYVMKTNKFITQYFYIADENTIRKYNEIDGESKTGIVFVLTQNLLIDDSDDEWLEDGSINPNGELAQTIKYLDNNMVTGEYNLYIEKPILSNASTSLSPSLQLYVLLQSFSTSYVNFEFEYVNSNEVSGNNVEMVLFKLKVSSK